MRKRIPRRSDAVMLGAGELNVALAMLRLARGWNQDELASRSGVRSSSISDYERGKIVPGIESLRRLLGAMGYPLAALDQALVLTVKLRAESALLAAARGDEESATPGEGDRDAAESDEKDRRALSQWEIEQAAIEAGQVVTRLVRLFYSRLGGRTLGEHNEEADSSES
jgi:transcriptional regulator with XRE-family HTH domain